MSSPNVAGLDP